MNQDFFPIFAISILAAFKVYILLGHPVESWSMTDIDMSSSLITRVSGRYVSRGTPSTMKDAMAA